MEVVRGFVLASKHHDLAQFCPHDLEELEQAADDALIRKTHGQPRSAGYIHEAKLPIKLPA
ncbi:MAG: hypothetical protein AB7U20_25970 [Planctomycetaceae bacterium]